MSNSLYARRVDELYYSWQFFGSPHASFLGLACDDGGGLVGCLALHCRELEAWDRPVAWILDVMVAPAHQRKGLFAKLLASLSSRLPGTQPSALCIMANARARGAVSKLGWSEVATLVTHECSTRRSFELRSSLKLTRIDSFSTCESLLEQRKASPAQRHGLIATRRSAAFLEWRFFRNPRYAYEVYLAESGDKPFGYVVLKLFPDPFTGRTFGDIVDVFWSEDDTGTLRDLLILCLERFAQMGIAEAATWLQTNTALDEIGLEVGFRPTGSERFFCVMPLEADARALENAQTWFLTMADSEVY